MYPPIRIIYHTQSVGLLQEKNSFSFFLKNLKKIKMCYNQFHNMIGDDFVKFDVLKNPWIPVLVSETELKEISMRDVLVNSHNYLSISASNPMIECGLYRLLTTLVLDIYQPRDAEDIQKLMDEGQFDEKVIDNYFEDCLSKGCSFDLFDSIHPWLQRCRREDDKRNIVLASYIDFDKPSGNNHIHYCHNLDDISYSPAEAAQLLPSYYTLTPMGGAGYYKSVNGTPPYFGFVQGQNLFETLVLSTPDLSMCDLDNLGSQPAFWKSDVNQYVAKEVVDRPSMIFSLMFPTREITFLPKSNGQVKEMLFGPGLKFTDSLAKDVEKRRYDPQVFYHTDDKRLPVVPMPDSALWVGLGHIIDDGAPATVRRLKKMKSIPYAHVIIYDIRFKKASIYSANAIEMDINGKRFQDPRFSELTEAYLSYVQAVSLKFQKILRVERGKSSNGNHFYDIPEVLQKEAMQKFNAFCMDFVFEQLRSEDYPEGFDMEKEATRWKENTVEIARNTFNSIQSRINTLTSKKLVRVMSAYRKNMLSIEKQKLDYPAGK